VTQPHDDPPVTPPDSGPGNASDVVAAKTALREQLRARRRARTPDARTAAADSLARIAATIPELAAVLRTNAPQDALEAAEAPQVVPRSCVAAYASYGTEPGTAPLRTTLAAAGVRVLLPVIRDDGDLDWAWDLDDLGSGAVSPDIPEPTGEVVGHGARGLVALGVRVLLAPALGVDGAGNRVGKAGGYYDRLLTALDDVGADERPLIVAVVHDDDVVDAVPVEAHDRRVDAVLTPTRYLDLR
jgi:5-formyltetrahydrofolate cyclo-ligase